jgi:HK97 family phage major capsid protein/HK97 family phage prohead protease
MTETIKARMLSRECDPKSIVVRKEEKGTFLTFSASSEAPVERWFGEEVLSHEKGSIRLDRFKRGVGPLLFNHDMADPIGMIDGARVEDSRLVVDAHLFETLRAQEVAAMLAGGLRNVSIGYRLYEVEEDKKSERFTATDWEPYEVSIVTVPADPSVGIGRSEEFEVRMIRQQAQTAKEEIVVSEETAAAGTSAETKVEAVRGPSASDLEKGRRTGIDTLCKACKIDDDIRQMFIASGQSLEEVGKDIDNIVRSRETNNPKVPSKLGLSDREAQKFSFGRALLAAATGKWDGAGFELECSRAIYQKTGKPIESNKFYVPYEVQESKRDMTVGTTTAGGFLVATENMSFIELLRNRTVAYRMGAQRMPGLVGSVTIPKQTVAATPIWLANEASTITESTPTFAQVALSPKSVGAYIEISRQLLLQSQPAAEQIAMQDVANVAAIAVDLAVLSGSGAGGQPTGITNTAGIGAFTGTSLAAAGVLDAMADVAAANVTPMSPGYVTTAAVAALLMARPELPSTGTTRLWMGSMWDGTIFDTRAMSSAQMAAATMLFGDWSKVVVGEWGTLEVETNPYANFQAGIIGIRAIITIDVGVRYAGAFSLASSIT